MSESVEQDIDPAGRACPICADFKSAVFYTVRDMPLHSVRLLRTRDEATSQPRADVELAVCSDCGFVWNTAFEPSVMSYSSNYEATQSFSPAFRSFHEDLASRLVERHGLHGKTIMEIGCGQGEFLNLLCEIGDSAGFGFDPAFVSERKSEPRRGQTSFIAGLFPDKYDGRRVDFIACKMTLEHIHEPGAFVSAVRGAVPDDGGTVVFFQVPDFSRILNEAAFWDVYYEHCSYFTASSLNRLFTLCGLRVDSVWNEYDDQYLMIEARAAAGSPEEKPESDEPQSEFETRCLDFAARVHRSLDTWGRRIRAYSDDGRRVVLWCGGSKASSFLNHLKIESEVDCVVDVNPYRQGTFLEGCGHEIVAPRRLQDVRPDLVIVMNPVYTDEIHAMLSEMGLHPEIETL